MSLPAETSDTHGPEPVDPGHSWWRYTVGPNPADQASAPDEVYSQPGQISPHWNAFIQSLNDLGHAEVQRRWDDAQGLIRQNGVTYNVYGDPRGLERPWQLDPLPLLISAAEWCDLEKGLVQRARLLDQMLLDLYGSQRLLTQGLIPPELVLGNPAFLRACHAPGNPRGRFLHLYAADLGRQADGSFRVLGDRTQAPSGAGYALQNRLVLTRMWPDVFRDFGVQRLARFFQSLRDGLQALAPHNRDTPRIVLLTPGPYNETYYEQAFLARYLGYTLVEGADLTVRDNRVYLKQLGGLQQVDVILRRLDDDYCDPLELREDSFLGVPGLIQAVSSGNVAVANPLGTGLLESPAFQAFLPAVCRRMLGEELLLESAPTWWCGDTSSRRHVLANLGAMVIKPTFVSRHFDAILGAELSAADRKRLAERIEARPSDFVAQERLSLSTTPVMVDTRVQPRRNALRAFVAARADGYQVMPGGLARVSNSESSPVVSMQLGGGSKDMWVLSAGTVSPFSLLPTTTQSVELSRAGSDLPSRIADNLFWLGRYVERAECLIRLLRVILERMTEQSGFGEMPELLFLLRALAHATRAENDLPSTEILDPFTWFEESLVPMVSDPEREGSLAATLSSVQRIASTVRDRISLDLWRTLRRLHTFEVHPNRFRSSLNLSEYGQRPYPAGVWNSPSELLDQLDEGITTLAAFSGLVSENMTRGPGWTFLDMGRRLERAQQLSRLLRNTLTTKTAAEGRLLEAVLAIADSSMTYRRRYLAGLVCGPVLDLLLSDESNPRSIVFQIAALLASIDSLSGERTGAARSTEQRVALSLLTDLRLLEVERLTRVDGVGRRPELDRLLERIGIDMPVLSNSLAGRYFNHLQVSRHLARSSGHAPS